MKRYLAWQIRRKRKGMAVDWDEVGMRERRRECVSGLSRALKGRKEVLGVWGSSAGGEKAWKTEGARVIEAEKVMVKEGWGEIVGCEGIA